MPAREAPERTTPGRSVPGVLILHVSGAMPENPGSGVFFVAFDDEPERIRSNMSRRENVFGASCVQLAKWFELATHYAVLRLAAEVEATPPSRLRILVQCFFRSGSI